MDSRGLPLPALSLPPTRAGGLRKEPPLPNPLSYPEADPLVTDLRSELGCVFQIRLPAFMVTSSLAPPLSTTNGIGFIFTGNWKPKLETETRNSLGLGAGQLIEIDLVGVGTGYREQDGVIISSRDVSSQGCCLSKTRHHRKPAQAEDTPRTENQQSQRSAKVQD